jgi:hypothetical protein
MTASPSDFVGPMDAVQSEGIHVGVYVGSSGAGAPQTMSTAHAWMPRLRGRHTAVAAAGPFDEKMEVLA